MDRRKFTQTTLLGGLSAASGLWPSFGAKSHILTLSFDDGFKKSFLKIAEIYEDYGLKGCFNVIASGHFPTFKAVDAWILPELMGNFDDWNSLVERGHEVMPHSWQHLNLANQPIKESKKLITKCLDYFDENLEGYDPQNAVFNFPFNATTKKVEKFTLSKVRAIRAWGDGPVNPIPSGPGPIRISCSSRGPNNIDDWVEKQVNTFLENPKGGWLVLNLHGLDNEGWGPISTNFLIRLMKRLSKIDRLEILPAGEVIKRTV